MNADVNHADSSSPGCVLIVGPSPDCREVLTAALASRGLKAFSARGVRAGLRLMREHEPDVVVLDGEFMEAGDQELQAELQSQIQCRRTPLIVLGRARGRTLRPRHVLAKPYHFAPLVHTIQELAAARAA